MQGRDQKTHLGMPKFSENLPQLSCGVQDDPTEVSAKFAHKKVFGQNGLNYNLAKLHNLAKLAKIR